MARDANGNYTLPPGNPVVPLTIIETDWANPTMTDIAAALSDSLSRTGQGGMLVPLKFADGTVNSPGIQFENDPNTGIWRSGDGSMTFVSNGAAVFTSSPGLFSTASGVPIRSGAGFQSLTNATISGSLTGVALQLIANTVTGATLRGYGSGADVTIMNRAGVAMASFNPSGSRITTVSIDLLANHYVGRGGTGGVSFDASNNATFTGSVTVPSGASGAMVPQYQEVTALDVANMNAHLAALDPHPQYGTVEGDYIPLSQKGAPGGVPPLDMSSKIPQQYLNFSSLTYVGGWDASGGTLPLSPNNGDVWSITVAGTIPVVPPGGVPPPVPTLANVGNTIIWSTSQNCWFLAQASSAINDARYVQLTGGTMSGYLVIPDGATGAQAVNHNVATAVANSAVNAHVLLPDPHTQYTTVSEVQAEVNTGITAHVAQADPHAQYLLSTTASTTYISLTEKGAPFGVAPLNGSTLIDPIYLPITNLQFQGSWDASAGTLPPSPQPGDLWFIAVAGTITVVPPGGETPVPFAAIVGDNIVYSSRTLYWYLLRASYASMDARYLQLVGGTITGSLTVNANQTIHGTLTFPTAITLTANSQIGKTAGYGLTLHGTIGTTADFGFANSNSAAVLWNPTGSTNIEVAGQMYAAGYNVRGSQINFLPGAGIVADIVNRDGGGINFYTNSASVLALSITPEGAGSMWLDFQANGLNSRGGLRVMGALAPTPTSGAGIEGYYDGAGAVLQAYSRDTATYLQFDLYGYNISLNPQGGIVQINGALTVTGTITGSITGDAGSVDGQHFRYSNDSNSPTYVWGSNASGDSFLSAPAAMSVAYAATAGSAPANGGTSTWANNLAITGFGNGGFTFYQSADPFGTWASGWAHFLVSNHGDGATYYNHTIILPLDGTPPLRMGMVNSVPFNPIQFIDASNIAAQSVSYAASSGSAAYATDAGTLGGLPAASLSVAYAASAGSAPVNPAVPVSWTALQTVNMAAAAQISDVSGTAENLMIYSQHGVGTAAFMSFHVGGAFALNFGLSSRNTLAVGGWSMGAVDFDIYHQGNISGASVAYATSAGSAAYATDAGTLGGLPAASLSVAYAASAGSAPAAGGNADTVDSQHFSYSNDNNAPTYLWATDTNGTSYLASRAAMSVAYADTAGSAPANGGTSAACSGNSATASYASDSALLGGLPAASLSVAYAASAGSAPPNTAGAYTWTGIQTFSGPYDQISGGSDNNPLDVMAPAAGYAAMMTFHIGGQFILNFGLDGITNTLSVGGGSMGAVSYSIYHTGNISGATVSNSDMVDGQHFTYANNSNAPTYVWGIDASGSSYLAARAYMGVAYADQAGVAGSCTGNSATASYATDSGALGGLPAASLSVAYAASAGSAPAAGGNSDSVDGFHFAWSDPGIQQSYLWAITDGANTVLCTPAVLSVGYAASAGTAASCSGNAASASIAYAVSTGSNILMSNADPVDDLGLEWQLNGLRRWDLVRYGTESGGNTGSTLYLRRFDDVGNMIGSHVAFDRASGSTTFYGPTNFNVGVNCWYQDLGIAQTGPIAVLPWIRAYYGKGQFNYQDSAGLTGIIFYGELLNAGTEWAYVVAANGVGGIWTDATIVDTVYLRKLKSS